MKHAGDCRKEDCQSGTISSVQHKAYAQQFHTTQFCWGRDVLDHVACIEHVSAKPCRLAAPLVQALSTGTLALLLCEHRDPLLI